ncbi:hypothetical protein D3C71_1760800 [compost metagenome]
MHRRQLGRVRRERRVQDEGFCTDILWKTCSALPQVMGQADDQAGGRMAEQSKCAAQGNVHTRIPFVEVMGAK